jgi:hypothetical protein
MPTDDNPEQQSDEETTESDQSSAQSDGSPTSSAEPNEQAAEGTDQAAESEQSDEQVTDETDQTEQQPEEQPEDQPASESDQPAETSSDESDQFAEQPDQVADLAGEQADTGGAGTGTATDDFADNTVATAGGKGGGTTKISGRNLKVIAEFTQEGDQKFIGDIMIKVFESDNGQQGRFLFPTGGQFWQSTTSKDKVIATPMLRVTTPEVTVWAQTRATDGTNVQNMDWGFAIPMPSGDTLQVAFDVEVAEVEKKVNAPDEGAAKTAVTQSPPVKGHVVFNLDAQSVGNQQFRVTGKFYTGDIKSSLGQRINQ